MTSIDREMAVFDHLELRSPPASDVAVARVKDTVVTSTEAPTNPEIGQLWLKPTETEVRF